MFSPNPLFPWNIVAFNVIDSGMNWNGQTTLKQGGKGIGRNKHWNLSVKREERECFQKTQQCPNNFANECSFPFIPFLLFTFSFFLWFCFLVSVSVFVFIFFSVLILPHIFFFFSCLRHLHLTCYMGSMTERRHNQNLHSARLSRYYWRNSNYRNDVTKIIKPTNADETIAMRFYMTYIVTPSMKFKVDGCKQRQYFLIKNFIFKKINFVEEKWHSTKKLTCNNVATNISRLFRKFPNL